jgi:SAM-dependent methyltransferase
MTSAKVEIDDRTRRGSPERFGYSWHVFNEILPVHEEQFRRWTSPLAPEAWTGKSILDVGCGIGRNTYWPMSYGASAALAIDLDERSLEAARRNLAKFPTARVERRSAYEIAETDRFDIAFSIGVIHHLDDPLAAVVQMVKATRPGGTVLVWLYGRENNDWLINWFNPLRKLLFSRAPLKLVFAIAVPLTAILWTLIRVLPLRLAYFKLIRTFGFRHLLAIVFDHMIPRIALYYTREQAIRLLEQAGLQDVTAEAINDISWTVVGKKPAEVR